MVEHEPPGPRPWRVMRQDDNGNRYLVGHRPTREAAERMIAELEVGSHKQLYWAEPDSDHDARLR